jgi:hypothetical protein
MRTVRIVSIAVILDPTVTPDPSVGDRRRVGYSSEKLKVGTLECPGQREVARFEMRHRDWIRSIGRVKSGRSLLRLMEIFMWVVLFYRRWLLCFWIGALGL